MLFFWIALYGFVNLIPEVFCCREESVIWLRAGLLAGYALLLLFWICRCGRQREAGLQVPRGVMEAPAFLLPLAVFPVCNLLTNRDIFGGPDFMLQMLCVALIEELFFRGFLLFSLRKFGTIRAIVLTSIAFALLHGLNFQENPDDAYVWLQICSSFCVSMYYCCFVVRFGSILPCVAAHFLTNVTAAESIGGIWAYTSLTGSMIICIILSWILIKDTKKRRQ